MAAVTGIRHAPAAPRGAAGVRAPLASNDALVLSSVTREFGALRAVDEVSVTVAAGQKYAILGSNGAGKTTLFNTITGDFPPTRGRIHFFGEDITELPPHERIRKGLRPVRHDPAPEHDGAAHGHDREEAEDPIQEAEDDHHPHDERHAALHHVSAVPEERRKDRPNRPPLSVQRTPTERAQDPLSRTGSRSRVDRWGDLRWRRLLVRGCGKSWERCRRRRRWSHGRVVDFGARQLHAGSAH